MDRAFVKTYLESVEQDAYPARLKSELKGLARAVSDRLADRLAHIMMYIADYDPDWAATYFPVEASAEQSRRKNFERSLDWLKQNLIQNEFWAPIYLSMASDDFNYYLLSLIINDKHHRVGENEQKKVKDLSKFLESIWKLNEERSNFVSDMRMSRSVNGLYYRINQVKKEVLPERLKRKSGSRIEPFKNKKVTFEKDELYEVQVFGSGMDKFMEALKKSQAVEVIGPHNSMPIDQEMLFKNHGSQLGEKSKDGDYGWEFPQGILSQVEGRDGAMYVVRNAYTPEFLITEDGKIRITPRRAKVLLKEDLMIRRFVSELQERAGIGEDAMVYLSRSPRVVYLKRQKAD